MMKSAQSMQASKGLALRVALLAALFFGVALGAPQSPAAGKERAAKQQQASKRADSAKLRERWEGLSPSEKERVRKNYERYSKLNTEERSDLLERGERLDEIAARIRSSMEPAQRVRLERLPQHKQREILRELAAAEVRSADERIMAKLPAEVRERLEGAEPKARTAYLTRLRERQDRRLMPLIQQLARDVGMGEQEVAELEALPAKERKQRFLELAQQLSMEEVEGRELPPGLSPDRWERMKKLSPEAFFDALHRLRMHHPDFARVRRGRGGRSTDAGGNQRDAESARDAGPTEPRRRAIGRLRRATEDRPQDRIDFADLPSTERDAALVERKRGRAEVVIREEELLSAEALSKLLDASDERFFGYVRSLMRASDRSTDGAPGQRRGTGPDGEDKRRPARGLGDSRDFLEGMERLWQALSAEERLALAKRYGNSLVELEMGTAGPGQAADGSLRTPAERRLKSIQRRMHRDLSPEEMLEWELVPRGERRRVLDQRARDELRGLDQAMNEVLSPDLRVLLRDSLATDRSRLMRWLKGPQSERGGERHRGGSNRGDPKRGEPNRGEPNRGEGAREGARGAESRRDHEASGGRGRQL